MKTIKITAITIISIIIILFIEIVIELNILKNNLSIEDDAKIIMEIDKAI